MLPGLTRAAGIHYPASAGWTPPAQGGWMLNRRSRRVAGCLALIAALGAAGWPAAYVPRVHVAAQTGRLATAFATAARTFGVPEPEVPRSRKPVCRCRLRGPGHGCAGHGV